MMTAKQEKISNVPENEEAQQRRVQRDREAKYRAENRDFDHLHNLAKSRLRKLLPAIEGLDDAMEKIRKVNHRVNIIIPMTTFLNETPHEDEGYRDFLTNEVKDRSTFVAALALTIHSRECAFPTPTAFENFSVEKAIETFENRIAKLAKEVTVKTIPITQTKEILTAEKFEKMIKKFSR